MNIYVLCMVVAVLELFLLVYDNRERIVPIHLLAFIMANIAIFGYVLISKSPILETSYIGNQIAYIGGISSNLAMLVCIGDVCHVKLPKKLYYAFGICAVIVLWFVFNPDKSDLYYVSCNIVKRWNMYCLDKQRGPMYFFMVLFSIGCPAAAFYEIISAMILKKRISLVTANLLLIMQIFSVVLFFIPKIVGDIIDIGPISYVMVMAFMLAVFERAKLYDLSTDLINISEQRSKEYGYACFDQKKRFMGATESVYRSAPEMLEKRIDSIIDPDTIEDEMPRTVIKWLYNWIDKVPEIEDTMLARKGEKSWDVTIREMPHENKIYYILEFHDDTRDQQYIEAAQKARREAEEANESKSAFLSVVSHEIRTPMNAVVGMTDLLLRDKENLTPKQEKYLKNIKTSGAALVMLVNDILDQSKIDAGKMQIVESAYELRPMTEDVKLIIENRIGTKPIHLIYEIDEEVPRYLVGDSLRIRQILINLMNNAVKFTEEGYIRFSINCVKNHADKHLLRFSVEDSGQGMSKEDLARIGEAFVQVDVKKNHSKEGTGLGLSISRDFISMMGGKLEVKSEYGKGTEFFFEIWQGYATGIEEDGDTAVSKQAWQEEEEFTAEKSRILIVDDTEINLMVEEEMLSTLKMTIDTARSGAAALELVKSKRYDLILMDYMMPYMDGVETTQKIRSMASEYRNSGDEDMADYLKSVPIVTLTGDSSEDTKEKFRLAGIDDFTEKPADLKRLKKVMIKWLPAEHIQAVK